MSMRIRKAEKLAPVREQLQPLSAAELEEVSGGRERRDGEGRGRGDRDWWRREHHHHHHGCHRHRGHGGDYEG